MRLWTSIPNFVDTEVFRPARDQAEKHACRQKLGIPEDAFVVGTVAAVKKHHKRIDYLIREFMEYANRKALKNNNGRAVSQEGRKDREASRPSRSFCEDSFLLICGARTGESDELMDLADLLAPEGIKFFFDLPREQMPDYYRALDVFALTSLFEMMPIAVLEALAGGLPVICNRHPVLEWMVGKGEREREWERAEGGGMKAEIGRQKAQSRKLKAEMEKGEREREEKTALSAENQEPGTHPGGATIDMSKEGELAGFLQRLDTEWIAKTGRNARRRAEKMFSKEVVICEYMQYYMKVMGRDGRESRN